MENNNQSSFWKFSDQLRVQGNNLLNLSLNDSIWSNSYVPKRPEKDRRNFDIRVGSDVINHTTGSNNNNNTTQSDSNFNGFNFDWRIGSSGVIGSSNPNPIADFGINGLPPCYRDSVRQITPGLPLFLYNYSTHQLHGVFEAASFGGTNIDPSAWEDKKNQGESCFPAQVRVMTRNFYEPLEEDSFRPILHHYDGPKFRLELNVPEVISLLDIFEEKKD